MQVQAETTRWRTRLQRWLCAKALESWCEPAPLPRPSNHAVQIALRPSRILRRALLGLQACTLLYAIELALLGHPVIALAACAALPLLHRRHGAARASGRDGQPQRLVLTADGRLFLVTAGQVQPLQLAGSSLHLGPWLLLQAHGDSRRHCWVLGPDNVPAAELATLRRRLLRVGAAAEAAALPGSGRAASRRGAARGAP